MIAPLRAAKNARTSSTLLGPSVAGSTGTSADVAAARAAALSPSSSSTPPSGPTNVRPAEPQARANAALSLRNP